MPTKIEELRKKLEKKMLLKRPYEEIYQISVSLDNEINKYYINSGLMVKKQ